MPITMFLMSSFAHAWNVKTNNSGQVLHWKNAPIHYSINTDGTHDLSAEAVDNAINQAANAWNNNKTQMIFDGETKKTGADYSDGVQSIVFKDNWTEDPSVLAITYTWSTEDGEIVHFDMEINAEDHEWSTTGDSDKQDLMNAITHEFGHAIGLDHSQDTNATMAPDSLVGETSKRDLNSDDLAGYEHIYSATNTNDPANSSGNNGNTGNGGGVGATPNHNGQTGNGMVPLNNAGCSSISGNATGLWALLGAIGFVFRRSKPELR